MSGYVLKADTSELEYRLNWAAGYLDPGESLEADLGWEILPVEGAKDLRVVAQDIGTESSRVVLAGGVPGRVYMVSARARTSHGRDLARAVVVRIAV